MLQVTTIDGYNGLRTTIHESQDALSTWLENENKEVALVCYALGITAGGQVEVKSVVSV
jgi:hypothetical protein